MRVAIFASGNGTNFEVLADKFAKNYWKFSIAFL